MTNHQENEQEQSTWRMIQTWAAKAVNTVELLPVEGSKGEEEIARLKLSLRSTLGAVAQYTGGILVQHGWLRILGSGSPRLSRRLTEWNEGTLELTERRLDGALLVADDVMGGFFALNFGAFDGGHGDVYYFAPDTLKWERFGVPYSDFLEWACSGDLDLFYETFRWPGWKEELERVRGDQAFSVYPPLCMSGEQIQKRSRAIVSVEEVWGLTAGGRA